MRAGGGLVHNLTLRPLLAGMAQGFEAALRAAPELPATAATTTTTAAAGAAAAAVPPLLAELVDAMNVTAARAAQVLRLYDFAAASNRTGGRNERAARGAWSAEGGGAGANASARLSPALAAALHDAELATARAASAGRAASSPTKPVRCATIDEGC